MADEKVGGALEVWRMEGAEDFNPPKKYRRLAAAEPEWIGVVAGTKADGECCSSTFRQRATASQKEASRTR
jgi:hypothetical protein